MPGFPMLPFQGLQFANLVQLLRPVEFFPNSPARDLLAPAVFPHFPIDCDGNVLLREEISKLHDPPPFSG